MGRNRKANRRGFPDNLYQDDNGYFTYRNPLNGERKGVGRDKASAFKQARQANAVLATMEKSSLANWVAGKTEHTLLTWIPMYEEIWTREEKPAKGTLDAAKRYFKRIEKAEFAWMQVADITTAHVAQYLDKLLIESTPSVTTNIRSRLHDIFRIAITKGLIGAGTNPVTETSVPEYKVKRERLSLEQFYAIRAKVSPWAQHGMDLALMTGQRLGDIVNMKFADYRDGSLFTVQGKTGYKLQQDGRIRLEAAGMSIEDAVKQCRNRVVSKHLVHHTRTSGNYRAGDSVSQSGLSDAFSAARDACGIKAAEGRTPPTFHEIRSLAERLYRKEYGQEFAQSIMGHKHAKMTAEYNDTRGGDWKIIEAKP